MKDFEQFVDTKILPSIREQLLKAYSEGYQDSSKDNYIKANHLERLIADFGLPSGTIWIAPQNDLTFRQAVESGLQFPTIDQIRELRKCKWSIERDENGAINISVKGPNGHTEQWRYYEDSGNGLCIWTDESINEEKDFYTTGYIDAEKGLEPIRKSTRIFVGDKFSTMFVLPKELV